MIRSGESRTTNDGQRMALRRDASAPRRPARPSRALGLADRRARRRRLPRGPGLRVAPRAVRAVRHRPGRLRQPRPRRPAERPARSTTSSSTTPRATYDDHAQAGAGPDVRSPGTTRCAPSDGHIAQHVDDQGRRLARRQLVRQHALDRHRARGLRGHRARPGTPSRCTGTPPSWCSYLAAEVRHPARPGAHHRPRPGARHHSRRLSPACTGTRARTGTGSTTSTCSARRSTADRQGAQSDVVTVMPGFADNRQPVTGCDDDPARPTRARPQGTNFVYLHTSRRHRLAAGRRHRPAPRTAPRRRTDVADIGARAAAGQKFVVAGRSGDWTGVWYLGQLAWFNNPGTPTPVRVRTRPGRQARQA